MGQYYATVIKGDDGVINYNGRKVKDAGYIMAKLLEHSYFKNTLVDSVANLLLNHKCKLAWIGDYAKKDEVKEITNGEVDFNKVWFDPENPPKLNENEKHQEYLYRKFPYTRKYLVNWDKKEYISFNDYKKHYKFPNKTLVISPIPLMTAIGNNRGGGDYYDDNPNFDKVGNWAWNEISIEGKIPSGFKKLDVYFKESYIEDEENRIAEEMEKEKNFKLNNKTSTKKKRAN